MWGQTQWGTEGAKEPPTALLKVPELRGMCNCHSVNGIYDSTVLRIMADFIFS